MYTKRITVAHRARGLFGLGNGPITSPKQVDVPIDDDSVLIGSVGPKRVECADLPADSPWRGPNGPCPPVGSSLVDWLKGLFAPTPAEPAEPVSPTAPPVPVAEPSSMLPMLAVLAVAGGGAYYLLTKKKRRS